MNNTLVLTGMMGSGKSSIGKELSNILSSKFYDTDLEIEKMLNMTVPNIFKNKGENYFRKIEEKICIDLINGDEKVVALGGGAFLNKKIREIVLKKSTSVWIDVDISTIVKRMKISKNIRPMLDYKDLKNSITGILAKRSPIYQLANIRIKATNIGKKKIANEIKKKYELSKKN
ncbi:shikimate kinase [Pelagibacteraceae bacterium]|nr:shikimate kinase [Pelagibacteraceae bacterium]